jgi:hypothetical protein
VAGVVPNVIELVLDSAARFEKRSADAGVDFGAFDLSGDQAFAEALDKMAADNMSAVVAARAILPTATEKLAEDAVLRQTMVEAFSLARGAEPPLDKTAAMIGYGLSEGYSPAQIQAVFEKAAVLGFGDDDDGAAPDFDLPELPGVGEVFTGAADLAGKVGRGVGNIAEGVGSGLGAVGSGVGQAAQGVYGALGGGARALGALGVVPAALGAAGVGIPLAHYGLQRKFRDLPDAGLAGNMRRYLLGLSASEQAAMSETNLARASARAERGANARLQRLEAQRRGVAATRQQGSAMARANRIADLEGMGGLSRMEAERVADDEIRRRGLSNASRAQRQLGVGRGVANVSVNGLAMPLNYGRALRSAGPAAAGLLGGALLMRGMGGGREEDEEPGRRPRISIG